MTPRIVVAPHRLLEVSAFMTRFAQVPPETPAAVTDLIAPDAPGLEGFRVDDGVRTAVRDLLRAGGFKPAGRSKPASEYLVAALAEGRFPRITAAVDACNVVSLHTGLPISLVDVDKLVSASGELRVACAPAGTSYLFNPSGQTIDASHLLCVVDDDGPTGTPVKDAQRTKTHEGTRAALSIVWGTRALAGRTAAATAFYRALVAQIPGATVEDVAVTVEMA